MKIVKGKVVANKMKQTVVVEIERRFTHPLYKKSVKRFSRIKAHTSDPISLGETVTLTQTRPLSKETHYQVVDKKTQK